MIKRRLVGLKKDEIEDFFSSHDFPDKIKAIKDFFLSIGIESVGYKLPKERVKDIPLKFSDLIELVIGLSVNHDRLNWWWFTSILAILVSA